MNGDKLCQNIIDNLFDGIAVIKILYDKKGRIADFILEEMNLIYEKDLSIKREDSIGKSVFGRFPHTEDNCIRTLENVALTGEPIEIESHISETNRYYHIRVLSPQKGYIALVKRDITEKKQLNVALSTEREMIRKVFDTSPILITIYKPSISDFYVNKEFEKKLGYTNEDAQKINLMEACFPDPEYRKEVSEFMGSLKKEWKDVFMITKSGEKIETTWINISLSDKTQVGIGVDITERKELERNLVAEREKFEKASNAKSEFLSNMSHELRTPLNGILGFSNYLGEIEKDNCKKDILNMIESSGQNLVSLINDILEISKIEAGKMTVNNEKFSLLELINEIEILYDKISICKENRFIVNKNIKTNNVIGDLLKVKQILTNLLGNAIKFTENGAVYLEIKEKIYESNKTHLTFSVKDTGIGINKEKTKNLFTPFEQGDSSITKKYGGTGLGLSIVKKLTDLMNGEITVESEIGKGTTFEVTIPFEVAEETSRQTTFCEINLYNFSNFTILIAEDDEVSLRLMTFIIESTGIKYHIALDGEEVVKKFDTKKFDLILMDLQMPNMSGLDATKKIKAKNPSLPIIATTAYAMKEDIDRALAYGVDDYIAKPYSKVKVLDTLKKWLHR